MEKICDNPLIEFDIYNVFEIKVLRQKLRSMQDNASAKLLEMYKLIITYLVIIYEGFEAQIIQVSICPFLRKQLVIYKNYINLSYTINQLIPILQFYRWLNIG